jgi:O-antigen/teichoic acid export membrane protein
MMTAAVLLFSTVQSLLYAAILQSILQILILLVYLTRRFGNFWFAFDFNFFLKHMRYAFPIGFAGLIWILQGDLHNYFVSYRFGAEQFAIYAYGCFQIPLIAILREAVASVLIPKMSELEVKGDKAEMIRLTFRAIQKLSFFYFPLYVFLFLTADTFIKTLFTERFEASIPIFLVNLTLLPFEILILDPIVRAYRDLGDFLLKVRIIMLAVLIVFLYLAILYLNLTGVIAIVVSMIICEKLIFSLIAAHKLGITSRDLKSLLDVFKIAMISVIAGIVLMPFYFIAKDFTMSKFIAYFNSQFLAGTLFLALCMAIFSAVYLILSYYSGVIENEEKARLRELLRF